MKRQRRIYTGEAAVDAILEEAPRLTTAVDLHFVISSRCMVTPKGTARGRTYEASATVQPDDGPTLIAAEATPAALRRTVLEWLNKEAARQKAEAAKAPDVLPGQAELPLEEPGRDD